LNDEPRCRLQYDGDLKSLEFAIYKYSSSCYDPEEFFFPGSDYIDDTIKGALKAFLEAYPYHHVPIFNKILTFIASLLK